MFLKAQPGEFIRLLVFLVWGGGLMDFDLLVSWVFTVKLYFFVEKPNLVGFQISSGFQLFALQKNYKFKYLI